MTAGCNQQVRVLSGLRVEGLALHGGKAEAKAGTWKAIVLVEVEIRPGMRPDHRGIRKREAKLESIASRQTEQRHTPIHIPRQHSMARLIARIYSRGYQRGRVCAGRAA